MAAPWGQRGLKTSGVQYSAMAHWMDTRFWYTYKVKNTRKVSRYTLHEKSILQFPHITCVESNEFVLELMNIFGLGNFLHERARRCRTLRGT